MRKSEFGPIRTGGASSKGLDDVPPVFAAIRPNTGRNTLSSCAFRASKEKSNAPAPLRNAPTDRAVTMYASFPEIEDAALKD
jgi:hypothetical protein